MTTPKAASLKKYAGFYVIGVQDFQLTKEIETFLKEYPAGGLALFNSPHGSPDNIWKDEAAGTELVYEFLQKALPLVPFLCVDQEGGRVQRLRGPFVRLPSAQKISEYVENGGSTADIYELYRLAAKQMAMSEIRLNLAPVCDIRYPNSSIVVGDRSYGDRLDRVIEMVKVFCEAFSAEGVATTLKHMPGHGPTTWDSHDKAAMMFKSLEEVRQTDFKVFEKCASFAQAIMPGHFSYPDHEGRIFSLDKEWIEEFRAELPQGMTWITDDLTTMKAVSHLKPWRACLDAGYDFLLVCGDLDSSARAIEDGLKYIEQKNLDFAEEQRLELKLKHCRESFQDERGFERRDLPPFKKWKKQLLDIRSQAEDILEKINAA